MEKDIQTLVLNDDHEGIRQLLSDDPGLANAGICFDKNNTKQAHPLHRICDAVFAKRITDDEAVEIARIFLDFGARIDGNSLAENQDTPLMAAASLHAENLGIFYIRNGARIDLTDRNDGATALHWAAFCGRDKLVGELIRAGASIDQPDTSYNSTPLIWALQPLMDDDKNNTHNQVSCIKLLLQAGAAMAAFDNETIQFLKSLAKNDRELAHLLETRIPS